MHVNQKIIIDEISDMRFEQWSSQPDVWKSWYKYNLYGGKGEFSFYFINFIHKDAALLEKDAHSIYLKQLAHWAISAVQSQPEVRKSFY